MTLDHKHLRLSAQRALLGAVTPNLRCVSVALRDDEIGFRAVFSPSVTEEEMELVSVAATEVIADFPAPYVLRDEYLVTPDAERPTSLEWRVFERFEDRGVRTG